MAQRLSLLAAAALSTAITAPLISPAHAEESTNLRPQPQVENAKFAFEGRITATNVRVRSGPSENYYETERLALNAPVTVVGIRHEWLKIVPPAGSFSVVAKASVKLNDDKRTGTVTTDGLSVRAGSKLTPMKVTVQCRLKAGDVVEILGEQDEYYQIKPPAEAYLYVHQRFVEPVKKLNSTIADRRAERAKPEKGEAVQAPVENAEPVAEPIAIDEPKDNTGETVEEPAVPVTSLASETKTRTEPKKAVPATQPVQTVAVETVFDRLEARWNAAATQTLETMPTEELLAGYDALLADAHLPVSMRRVAEVRAASLRIKDRARREYLATMQQQQEAMKKIEALRAQRQVVETRLQNGPAIYTAVGSLQPSTLQLGKETLYRLTDPSTGRSLCYVRSDNPQFAGMIGRFVGIKGELGNDPQLSLRVIGAAEISPVDPERVNKGVTAQIVPPSLTTGNDAAKTEAASTDVN